MRHEILQVERGKIAWTYSTSSSEAGAPVRSVLEKPPHELAGSIVSRIPAAMGWERTDDFFGEIVSPDLVGDLYDSDSIIFLPVEISSSSEKKESHEHLQAKVWSMGRADRPRTRNKRKA